MGNQRVLGLPLIFAIVFLVATTYTCFGDGNMSVVCSEQERLALIKFKHSVRDDFEMLSSWVGNDCCRWKGIHCDGVTGKVERIHLRGEWEYVFQPKKFYLVGYDVNSSLAELSLLRHLDLSGNNFQGSQIPEFIGSLKHLSYLNLSYANFHGIIPHQVGNLSKLKVLDLSSNYGLKVDDMAWTSRLSSLNHLNLNSVDLRGAQNKDMVLCKIHSLKELSLSECGLSNDDFAHFLNSSKILSNIKFLDLSKNVFKGPLPGFFQNMTSLSFLDLSYFNLAFPLNFANLLNMVPSLLELHLSSCGLDNSFLLSPHINVSKVSNIQHLDLSRNSFEGIFSSVLTNISSLRVLDLSRNNLHSFVPIMPNLVDLDLSSNEFNQIEHVGIWRQCHLKKFSASYNYFDKKVIGASTNISECSEYALEKLDLSWSLNGTIPKELGRLANLRCLHLSGNRWSGPIPEFIRRLRYLEVLDLSYNMLSGPVSTFLGKLSKLDLSFNQMNGSIPESFGKLASLTDLNLEFNRLTGPIPTTLGRLVSLQSIFVSSNLLNGRIPISIGQLSNLHSLDISSNLLEGVVHEAHFRDLTKLKHLNISSNSKLTFNVSREWLAPFQLETLQLHSCNIANGFPHWLRNQRKLKELVLSNAKISGPLPKWLQKMPCVHFLDLSHNKLSGPLTNLPNEGNFDVVEYGVSGALYLENNSFSGSIPMSLCRRIDLEYLDLSRNRLTGEIPMCFENMQKLLMLKLNSNLLSGVVLSSIKSSSLVRLQLADNNFIGEVPQELANSRDLRILDLGDNKFSGAIPEWIGEKLTSLTVFRLHKNNFNGRIPESLCRISNLQILDIACNHLAGTIPNCLGELNAMVYSRSMHHIITPYSDDDVFMSMKGLDRNYKNIWYILFNVDLSNNNLVGEIPIELTTLAMLGNLNLSNNHLTGVIPERIGKMKLLESLDFSNNKLIGTIPPGMIDLTFLSFLNLSHNNLLGRIPTDNQFPTFSEESYVGNKDLCGPPLRKICSNLEDPTTNVDKPVKRVKVWSHMNIMSGFATGFWGIIGVLTFKKQWRQKLFMFFEDILDMKRGREVPI